MQEILFKHKKLVKPNFEKFKNNIKILIFFKNKIDVKNFKQILYFLLIKNKKNTNNIFNF